MTPNLMLDSFLNRVSAGGKLFFGSTPLLSAAEGSPLPANWSNLNFSSSSPIDQVIDGSNCSLEKNAISQDLGFYQPPAANAYHDFGMIPATSTLQCGRWADRVMESLINGPCQREALLQVDATSILLQKVVRTILANCPVEEVPEEPTRTFSPEFCDWAWRFLDKFLQKVGLVDRAARKAFYRHVHECLPQLFDAHHLELLERELSAELLCQSFTAAAEASYDKITQEEKSQKRASSLERLQHTFFVPSAATLKMNIRPVDRKRKGDRANSKTCALEDTPESPDDCSSRSDLTIDSRVVELDAEFPSNFSDRRGVKRPLC